MDVGAPRLAWSRLLRVLSRIFWPINSPPKTQCRIGFQPVSFPHGANPWSFTPPLLMNEFFATSIGQKRAGSRRILLWTGETGWKPILRHPDLMEFGLSLKFHR